MIQSQPDSRFPDPLGGLAEGGPLLRLAADRFHSQRGWLDSWHSFSFGGHFDPRWTGFGPLLVINDDRIGAGQGFGMHPHRDMEIITVMVEGSLNHCDSMGHSATLSAGEVQRMSAGTGIVHSEINGAERHCRLLQIWIEPSRPGLPPSYDQRAYPPTPGWTALIDPAAKGGAMAIQRPVRLWRASPGPGGQLDLPLEPGSLAWIQVIDGGLAVDREPGLLGSIELPGTLAQGDGLGFRAGQIEALDAGKGGADLLLFELR